MSEKQWVQHISGQGEKWELSNSHYMNPTDWQVESKTKGSAHHYLPKSEYRLCDPPEVWKDVTERCEITPTGLLRIVNDDKTHTYLSGDRGYRFLKVRVARIDPPESFGITSVAWAFIVEKKEPI